MDSIEPRELGSAPKYYRNPVGVGSYTNLQNSVKGRSDQLILTTEYVDSERVVTYWYGSEIVFKKLKNNYNTTLIQFGGFGGFGIAGIYIKGVITWTNGSQSAFSTINNIRLNNGVIILSVSAEGRTPQFAKLRISQLS